jgi:hypothetical protein
MTGQPRGLVPGEEQFSCAKRNGEVSRAVRARLTDHPILQPRPENVHERVREWDALLFVLATESHSLDVSRAREDPHLCLAQEKSVVGEFDVANRCTRAGFCRHT